MPFVSKISASVLMVMVSIAGLALSTGTAQAQSTVATELPAECPGGDEALLDVAFANSNGDVAPDLRQLPVAHGDTVTMTWSGWADGCFDANGTPATVSIAAYPTATDSFDMNSDEFLLPGWVTCVDLDSCANPDGGHVLTFEAPTADTACFFQVDAVLGQPLETVGPNGTYYNELLRRDGGSDLLISAKNTGKACEEPAPTTTAAPSTTVAPVTVPPTTEAPTPEEPTVVKDLTLSLDDEVAVKPAVFTTPATLPKTGTNTAASLLFVGLGLMGVGTAVLGSARQLAGVEA